MKIPNDYRTFPTRTRINMNHSYEEFLNSTIKSEDGPVTATFLEKNGKVYIVTPEFEFLFKMLYKPELHEYLLIAAQQLLDVKLEKDKAKAEVQEIASKLIQKQNHDGDYINE